MGGPVESSRPSSGAMFAQLFRACFHRRREPGGAPPSATEGRNTFKASSSGADSSSGDSSFPSQQSLSQDQRQTISPFPLGASSQEALASANKQQPVLDTKSKSPTTINTTTTASSSSGPTMPKAPRKEVNKSAAKSAAKPTTKPKAKAKAKSTKYFSGADNDHAAAPVLDAKSREVQLNQMFDSFRSPEEDADKDTMGVTSISQYANALSVDMLNFEYLVLCEVLQPQVLGQISRKEFVDGWKNQVDDTNHSIIPPTVEAQKTFIRRRIQQIPRNYTLFRNVYRQAFFSGREPMQKAISKEIALAFWELLFDEGVWPWRTNKVDWLGVWKEYIGEKWMRSVNKDMWNQTLEFARRTMEDDSLGFWNEDQAWPGVIDDFVVWCREQGFAGPGRKEGEGMEVD